MKIYALNGMQSHSEFVKKNVSAHQQIILRGAATDGDVQLLESSHRIAYAIELQKPVIIVLFNYNEIVPNDCDVLSVTGHLDRCTVGEHILQLLDERGKYNQAVYEAANYPNITIIDASNGSGRLTHMQLTHPEAIDPIENAFQNPCSAFPEKLHLTVLYASQQKILVVGNKENRPAIAFCKLGAEVTYMDICADLLSETQAFLQSKSLQINTVKWQDFRLSPLPDDAFDMVYAAGVCGYSNSLGDLQTLFSGYKRVLINDKLLVTLDTHPVFNIFDKSISQKITINRAYDDLTNHWRLEDILRSKSNAGLRWNNFFELQAGYGDISQFSDFNFNPLAAVPRWIATFSNK